MPKTEVRALHGTFIEEQAVEIVERKGLGHPDTICDMLSERFSVALSRHYLDRFGLILHHNVDKALLSAGSSAPAYGGGSILKPIGIYLGGRATTQVKGEAIPVEDIARQVVTSWFDENMHMRRHFKSMDIHCLVQPGSSELVDLFMRQRDSGVMLANDTSIGVGYAPLSELERIVLAVEAHINAPRFKTSYPATSEDVKVMGVRVGDTINLTVACAFIGQHLHDIEGYLAAKDQLKSSIREVALEHTRRDVRIDINVADNIKAGEVYLTVAGTSAEAGDDGETGRGNRINGLITPNRPMTLEAVAGKNPITHVGKIYNALAHRIARRLVESLQEVSEAECRLVSQIGTPIDQPAIVDVQLRTHDGNVPSSLASRANAIVDSELQHIGHIWRSFIDGSQRVA